jgi:signal transduction histidine kinase
VQGETIDHLSEGVAVFGPDGRIRLSNPAFRALWGITETEAKPGTHIRAIGEVCAPSYDQPDGWKTFAELITSFDDERRSSQGTLELLSGLVLDFAVIPLPNAQTMLTFVNMTDSVRAERALTEKNEALRKADELKNDFVQHVSYELRSPLTNIIGFTDLLRTPGVGSLNERQAEYIDHIATSFSILRPSMPASCGSTMRKSISPTCSTTFPCRSPIGCRKAVFRLRSLHLPISARSSPIRSG